MALGSCVLGELQEPGYTVVQSAKDIREIATGNNLSGSAEMTGMVVMASCGQFDEIWVTDSARPLERDTLYTRVS